MRKGAAAIRYIFLINPAAGKADATADLLPRIHAAAARAGIAVKRGLVATGDQFIASKEQIARIHAHFDALAAEMEGGAIGQVCTANGVPFAVLRAISDNADGNAVDDFPKFARESAEKSIALLLRALPRL